jgi:hypothetical protein
MDPMEQLMALLKSHEGLPDDAKSGIKNLFQEVTKKAGKAATDMETYKKGHTEYQKLIKKLEAADIDPDRFDSIAEELGVKKTLQDEVELYKLQNKDLATKFKEAEKRMNRLTLENTLGRKVEELSKAYTTADGKKVKIAEKFINKDELYKAIDVTNDVLVQDRIKRVLDTAFTDQVNFIKDLGLPEGVPLHGVPQGEGAPGSNKGYVDPNQVRGIMSQYNGSLDAAAQVLTMYEQNPPKT